MSQISNQAVLKCSQCGQTVILTHLSTMEPDEDLTILHQEMKDIANNCLCPDCQARHNYAVAQQNRGYAQDHILRPMARDFFPFEWELWQREQEKARRIRQCLLK